MNNEYPVRYCIMDDDEIYLVYAPFDKNDHHIPLTSPTVLYMNPKTAFAMFKYTKLVKIRASDIIINFTVDCDNEKMAVLSLDKSDLPILVSAGTIYF